MRPSPDQRTSQGQPGLLGFAPVTRVGAVRNDAGQLVGRVFAHPRRRGGYADTSPARSSEQGFGDAGLIDSFHALHENILGTLRQDCDSVPGVIKSANV